MNDTITKDQVLNAYNSAPDLVRATFNDEASTRVVMGLQAKYQLHVDQAGTLAKEVGYLLLGLTDPIKFSNRLKEGGFTEQMTAEIVREINQRIFMPLREKMKSAATGAPAKPSTPQPPPMPPRPVGAPAPAAPSAPQPQRYFHLENKLPAPRAAQLTTAPVPAAPQPTRPLMPATPVAPQAIRPPVAQVQPPKPMQMPPAPLQPKPINILGTVPKTEQPPATPSHPPVPTIVAPLPPKTVLPRPMLPRPGQSVVPVSMPIIQAPRPAVTPPANLPGAMPPSDLLPLRKIAPQAPAVAPKPYSADPYREPIEP